MRCPLKVYLILLNFLCGFVVQAADSTMYKSLQDELKQAVEKEDEHFHLELDDQVSWPLRAIW